MPLPRTVVNKTSSEKTLEYYSVESGVNTDVDVREGQKVVVGKSNFGAEDAFILVVTAKVVE